MNFWFNSQTYSSETIENFVVCDDLDFCLDQLNWNSALAVAIFFEHARNHLSGPDSQIYCFKNSEIISEYSLKFFVHDDFPYLNELNEFIHLTSASGLIEKWRSNKQMLNQSFTYKRKIHNRLVLYNFLGIFYVGAVMGIIVISTFFLERFVYTKVRTANTFRFWKIIEMMIDPNRHFLLEKRFYWKMSYLLFWN